MSLSATIAFAREQRHGTAADSSAAAMHQVTGHDRMTVVVELLSCECAQIELCSRLCRLNNSRQICIAIFDELAFLCCEFCRPVFLQLGRSRMPSCIGSDEIDLLQSAGLVTQKLLQPTPCVIDACWFAGRIKARSQLSKRIAHCIKSSTSLLLQKSQAIGKVNDRLGQWIGGARPLDRFIGSNAAVHQKRCCLGRHRPGDASPSQRPNTSTNLSP